METQRKIVMKLVTDLSSCLLVGMPFFLLYLFGDPFKRGFYCDDESIRYPFHESTVPSAALFIVSIGASIIVIIVGEYFEARILVTPTGWKKIDFYMWLLYHQIVLFAFGGLASQSLTDIAKYSIGRLRPHFISVCRPKIGGKELKDVCEQQQPNFHYIDVYDCDNNSNLRDARLSFMSGHSSFAAYSAVFIAMYIHKRMTSQNLRLARSLFQVFVIYLAIWVGFTRISDYKHHWSDVLIGLLQGSLVAICTCYYVGDSFKLITWGLKSNIYPDKSRSVDSSTSTGANLDQVNLDGIS